MSVEKHVEEFLEALNGGRGTLDAWLECNNEAECRAAINGAIAAARKACRDACENERLGANCEDEAREHEYERGLLHG